MMCVVFTSFSLFTTTMITVTTTTQILRLLPLFTTTTTIVYYDYDHCLLRLRPLFTTTTTNVITKMSQSMINATRISMGGMIRLFVWVMAQAVSAQTHGACFRSNSSLSFARHIVARQCDFACCRPGSNAFLGVFLSDQNIAARRPLWADTTRSCLVQTHMFTTPYLEPCLHRFQIMRPQGGCLGCRAFGSRTSGTSAKP